MNLSEFDFDLPETAIALRPTRPRDSAKMLVVEPNKAPSDSIVKALPDFLRAGDVMVFNDTRTIPAALKAIRPPRGPGSLAVATDVNLHKRAAPDAWEAFARPGKRLKAGDTLLFAGELQAKIEAKADDGILLLRFDRADLALDAAIARAGVLPLPPYIARKRKVDAADDQDYQTVYAREEGSVATPTAGLHFTEALLAAIDAKGVILTSVTLHVGAGTFLPVKVENIEDHVMHAEWCGMDDTTADILNKAKAEGRRIIAVGTTSLRTLESVVAPDGKFAPFFGDTRLFVTPGYQFRSADLLMTNFHLPKSTLIMLVSAFSGLDTMRQAYQYAIASGYRFYSYGDASLLYRA